MAKKKTIYVMLIVLKEEQGPVLALKSYTTKAKAKRAKANILKSIGKGVVTCLVQPSELM